MYPVSGLLCIKLTIDGNFAINCNYHGNMAQQSIKIKVSMVVTIDGKFTINGKFCATGPGGHANTNEEGKNYTHFNFHNSFVIYKKT